MDGGRAGNIAKCQEVIVTRTETTKTKNVHSRVLGTGRDQTSLSSLLPRPSLQLQLTLHLPQPRSLEVPGQFPLHVSEDFGLILPLPTF